ncbi:MAG TPA: ATP-binding protein [Azonexus sp.]|nr:ATP-binding protein [Azonexus sp.]
MRRRLYLKVLLVPAICLVLGAVGIYWADRLEVVQRKQDAHAAASVHGHLLEQQLTRSLSATYALAAVLRQGNGQVEDFDALASQMLDMYGGLSSLQLAPNGVIRHVVPRRGNEAAIGHNLLDDPERNKEAFLALKSRALTLAGPFELRQGGQAVVGRLPVFLDIGKRDEHFWGFTTALIRIPDLLRASALTGERAQGLDFVLTRPHPGSGEVQTIWQSTAEPMVDPVSIPVRVPNGEWTLSVVRTAGWHTPTLTLVGMGLAVLAISALSAFLAFHLLHQPLLLSQQVAVRTAELNQANESLQTEIFQHWQAELALRESERQLEQRVQERTQELELANAALQAEQAEQKRLIDKLADTRSQLVQSEMMAAVGQLAAGVAHEINNPLGYIVSNIAVMQRYVETLLAALARQGDLLAPWLADNPELSEQLKLVEDDIDLPFIREDFPPLVRDSLDGLARVRQIVQELREFSCVDRKDRQAVDLNRCLQSTLAIMANDFGERISISCDFGDLPAVTCNAPQLNQVFRNLLLNAVQAIEGKGEISLATHLSGDAVEIDIADSGHGIAPENLDRVFEPFFSTRTVGQGMGLGLAVAYHLLKRHGGSISVSSELEKGSRFTLLLPIAGEAGEIPV